MSVDEVAEVLDIPAATVRTQYFRARALLREGLAQEMDIAIGEAFSFAGGRCDRIIANVMAHARVKGLCGKDWPRRATSAASQMERDIRRNALAESIDRGKGPDLTKIFATRRYEFA